MLFILASSYSMVYLFFSNEAQLVSSLITVIKTGNNFSKVCTCGKGGLENLK